MRKFIKYILLAFAAIQLISCQTEENQTYFLQAQDGGNMKVGATISYLGIEVGEVIGINFANINNEDYVLATIQLKEFDILNQDSYIAWTDNGNLEIINTQRSSALEVGDTLLLKSKSIEISPETKNKVTTIHTKEIDNIEQKSLSPEEQNKLDSLQAKINKLNNLIKEVNDQD